MVTSSQASTRLTRGILLALSLLLVLSQADSAEGQRRKKSRRAGSSSARSTAITSVEQLKASSAILMDAVTGQVLFEKDADVPRPPASTTKIMTAILLMEHLTPFEEITASINAQKTGGSSLHLKWGEKITARDMLYAVMLRSANDGCVAVAEHIAGSEARFAEMMNAKAREIGATNTNFVNCNGLNCDTHYSTARDLALMARYAMRYPEFNAATRSKYFTIKRSSKSKDLVLKNHAKFLWRFPGADGIKTGWTIPAGRCFVGGATRKDWRLISVVLNSPDVVGETTALMNHGFETFERVRAASAGTPYGSAPISGGDASLVTAVLKDPLDVVRRRGSAGSIEFRPRIESVTAPVAAGTRVGIVEAFVDGRRTGEGVLVAAGPVAKSTIAATGQTRRRWFLSIAALVGVIGLGYGSSIAKAARIRRSRLKAIMRGANQRW